ncbi:hypothetical protein Nepgr_023187 [Nepenthes gracilis]|uniref:Uncharacterized protein n=1 Tax=Nepenthes gracilis TaxID=150966 RepID=A0AAD3XYV8_NEPGR|nr:hypothetical protein Nepgr_023187 [Nepenthes gracilis]
MLISCGMSRQVLVEVVTGCCTSVATGCCFQLVCCCLATIVLWVVVSAYRLRHFACQWVLDDAGLFLQQAEELATAWRLLCKMEQNPTGWHVAGSCDG